MIRVLNFFPQTLYLNYKKILKKSKSIDKNLRIHLLPTNKIWPDYLLHFFIQNFFSGIIIMQN